MITTTCDTCGAELHIGEFPFCGGDPAKHQRTSLIAIGDDLPGGYTVQHCPGLTGQTFYSKRAITAAAKAAGYERQVQHVDGDRHISRWI